MTASLICARISPRKRLVSASRPGRVNSREPDSPSTTSASISPRRIAKSISSASPRRVRSSAFSIRNFGPGGGVAFIRESAISCGRYCLIGLVKIEPKQNPFGMRHVADESAKRQRQHLDQCWRGNDLLALGQSGILGDVDDLQVVTPSQIFLAKLSDVRDRARRVRRRPGDVKPQYVALQDQSGGIDRICFGA